MKKLLLALSFIISTIVFADTSATWQLEPDAYGPVKIGMTAAQITKVTHKRLIPASGGMIPVSTLTAGHCEYVKFADETQDVKFMLRKGILVTIEVMSPGVITNRGIQVGDSEKKLMKAYKKELSPVEGNFYLYKTSKNKNSYGQMFSIDYVKKVPYVLSIASGKLKEVKLGCID